MEDIAQKRVYLVMMVVLQVTRQPLPVVLACPQEALWLTALPHRLH